MAVKLQLHRVMAKWLAGLTMGFRKREGQHAPVGDAAMPIQLRMAKKEEFVEPQRLFEALDGRDLSVSDRHWHLEVFSVTDQAQHRWVQVGLKGDQEFMLTLRLNSGAGAQPCLQALSSWLGDPSEAAQTSQIFHVA